MGVGGWRPARTVFRGSRPPAVRPESGKVVPNAGPGRVSPPGGVTREFSRQGGPVRAASARISARSAATSAVSASTDRAPATSAVASAASRPTK